MHWKYLANFITNFVQKNLNYFRGDNPLNVSPLLRWRGGLKPRKTTIKSIRSSNTSVEMVEKRTRWLRRRPSWVLSASAPSTRRTPRRRRVSPSSLPVPRWPGSRHGDAGDRLPLDRLEGRSACRRARSERRVRSWCAVLEPISVRRAAAMSGTRRRNRAGRHPLPGRKEAWDGRSPPACTQDCITLHYVTVIYVTLYVTMGRVTYRYDQLRYLRWVSLRWIW